MLVVPDVHGREFWKEPIKNNPKEEVVFLGDYVDPYSIEGITKEKALQILREIIELKESDPERITLLLGNHDFMYLDYEHKINGCRHDSFNETEIKKLLERPDLFKLVDSREISGITYVFSHAGIHDSWLKRHSEFGSSIKESISYLNNALWDKTGAQACLFKALLEVSWWRGGDLDVNTGSPIWADLREYKGDEDFGDNVFQIFGHTQLKEGYHIRTENFAEIDSKTVFRLTENKLEIV